MSYYAHSCTSDCVIPAENIPRLIEAYNKYIGEDGPHAETIEDIFENSGFVVEPMFTVRNHIDMTQNMTFWYEHNNWHSEDAEFLFNIIAPFMKPGSYLSMQGEDDCLWAYYFDGKSWEEYYGEVCFPGMPSEPHRMLDAGASIKSNLDVIFGPDLAAQIPKEFITTIESFKTPDVLGAIAHALLDVITQKTPPVSPVQDQLLQSLVMEGAA